MVVHFNNHLSWIPNLKDIKIRFLKFYQRVNDVKLNKIWCRLNLHASFLQSFVWLCRDYKSEVYSSARPSALKMLDPIHISFILLATGAFCSSPLSSLLADSGEPSLNLKRTQLLGKTKGKKGFPFKVKSLANQPLNHSIMFVKTSYTPKPN